TVAPMLLAVEIRAGNAHERPLSGGLQDNTSALTSGFTPPARRKPDLRQCRNNATPPRRRFLYTAPPRRAISLIFKELRLIR
ncbi:MAG TPA: hypothetical protein VE397_13350, partial [Stellaceae bacterium]|nr:hypothetical protein [Stellaceae bacterium]